MIFQAKCFSYYVILTDQIPLLDCALSLKSMCIAIVSFPGCDVTNFEINLSNQAGFFLLDQKVETKIQISRERKELLR